METHRHRAVFQLPRGIDAPYLSSLGTYEIRFVKCTDSADRDRRRMQLIVFSDGVGMRKELRDKQVMARFHMPALLVQAIQERRMFKVALRCQSDLFEEAVFALCHETSEKPANVPHRIYHMVSLM